MRNRRKGGSLHAKKTWARVGGAGGPEHERAWYKPAFPTHLIKLLKLLYTRSINSDLVLGDCKQYYVVLSQVTYL